MSCETRVSEGRRKLLKSIAAGSGAIIAGKSLPENWTKPVVDSVILPAHAGSSGVTGNFITDSSSAATNLCTEITGTTANINGTIDGVAVKRPSVDWPGTVEGKVTGSGGDTFYTIDLGFVSGTSPNRTLSVGLELTGNVIFDGPIPSPETPTCM